MGSIQSYYLITIWNRQYYNSYHALMLSMFLNTLHTWAHLISTVALWLSNYFLKIIIPFYRGASCPECTERWGNLPKVTQLVGGLDSCREAPGPYSWPFCWTNRSIIAPAEVRGETGSPPVWAPSLSSSPMENPLNTVTDPSYLGDSVFASDLWWARTVFILVGYADTCM